MVLSTTLHSLGSSIVTLATCWQEVVTKEVKLCLEMCDLSCVSPILPKPHDIVSAIVRVYDRLQHATMELFGGHSWFMVAVKEGFTSVFQSLDETAGVRVSEGGREDASKQHCREIQCVHGRTDSTDPHVNLPLFPTVM